MKRILISGFQAFLGQTENPSELLAKFFSDKFDVVLLPVEYGKAWDILHQKIIQTQPDFVLMLGQAAGRDSVCLEQVALNLMDSKYPDEAGALVQNQKISESDHGAFISALNLRQWEEEFSQKSLPIKRSLSAGSFLCNYLYYQCQKYFVGNSSSLLSCLFVHVPLLPTQVDPEKKLPTMGFGEMKKCVTSILEKIQSLDDL